ncbi:MlaD family protein [Nocardia mangyaensis]|uniref:MlaD family protein n=1 Tax=Nocardia mangyaensis TaxID=2213200 RepID=UPI002674F24A|nr:MlaD family protein [Nocardia mangyaensis]MDO3645952.1 MlaD family protein [Nocardia mangyaensis]
MRRAALFVATLLAAGCGFQPADLPVPGAGVGGPTYPLRIEFADVLNLPTGAKVIAAGVRVGVLSGVTLVDPVAATSERAAVPGYVVAEVDLRQSVRLAVGTTAELRQETPLGDVHIALSEPPDLTVGELAPGATIPLADTTQSPPIEDILAGLSTFIGSGAVTDFQNIVATMNGVFPDDPRDTARLADILGTDIADLGVNLRSVDALLDGMEATVEEGLQGNLPILDELLTPYGVAHTTEAVNAQIGVIFVLTALGPVAPSAQWLGPLLSSLDDTAQALVPMLLGANPLDTESPSNMKALVDLINTKLVPYATHGPKVDVVEVGLSPITADDHTARIVDTLRMIGLVR